MSKFSSFKEHQRATDSWRDYVSDSPQKTLHENTLGSAKAAMKGVLSNIGDMKEPVRYAAKEVLQNYAGEEVLKAAADMFLRIAETKIESHLIESADDIASRIVPDIPYDGDVIEGLMQRAFADIIEDQADEVAALVVNAVRDQFLARLGGDNALREALEGQSNPLEDAEDAIEAMDDAAQEKLLNALLSKLDTDGLQEAKGNPILKTLLKLPGGRDLAAMWMATLDRATPRELRILAAFAILNLISPVDVGTFMGLDFLGPLGGLDDLILLRRMFKKYKKAGLPSDKHHDQLQLAAGEDLSADRAAEVELDQARDLATTRQKAAGSREKMRKL